MNNLLPSTLTSKEIKKYLGRHIGPPIEIDTSIYDNKFLGAHRRFQRKSWVYVGFMHEDVIACMAIADAGVVGLAFAYFFDRKTKQFKEEKITHPLAFPTDFQPSLDKEWKLSSGNSVWKIYPLNDQLKFSFVGTDFSFRGSIQNSLTGLNTIAPSYQRPFNYTYKNVALESTLELSYPEVSFSKKGFSGVIDYTFSYPQNNTFWNWACLCGQSVDGKAIGINLVSDYNNGLENCLWVDGKAYPLAQAVFIYDDPIDKNSCRLYTTDGILELRFIPEGSRKEDIHLIILQSQFIQPFGSFTGKVKIDGNEFSVSGTGVLEEHYAVW
jgi:hypothetical protein